MKPARLLIVDDNIRCVGGHYFELVTSLATAAHRFGYEVHVAAHQQFSDFDAVPGGVQLSPIFRARRMVRWSMGVDGASVLPRGLSGRYRGPVHRTMRHSIADARTFRCKRPMVMMRRWREDLSGWLGQMQVRSSDQILVTTSDDFGLLALAGVLAKIPTPLSIAAIVHFALVDRGTEDATTKLKTIGDQIRRAMFAAGVKLPIGPTSARHQLRLFATTEGLTRQYTAAGTGLSVTPIDYPTRAAKVNHSSHRSNGRSTACPVRCGLAGYPRAEKGRESIGELLDRMTPSLRSGQTSVTLQAPADQWSDLIPKSATDLAACDDADAAISVLTGVLSTADYHRWIGGFDIGVFLYDPSRYEVRCSGILLELMVRGVPVIVPDRCHLADQVRRHGGQGRAGYIFRDRSEVPGLIDQFCRHGESMIRHCRETAAIVAGQHRAEVALRTMGFGPGKVAVQKAA